MFRDKWSVALIAVVLAIPLTLFAFKGFAGSTTPGSNADPLVTKSYADSLVQWNVLEMNKGQVLDCEAGTELIVRAGTAKIVAPTANVGVPDVTAGSDLVAGTLVPHNHHLIVPRTDGRGIEAQNYIIVMYKGKVTVR